LNILCCLCKEKVAHSVQKTEYTGNVQLLVCSDCFYITLGMGLSEHFGIETPNYKHYKKIFDERLKEGTNWKIV